MKVIVRFLGLISLVFSQACFLSIANLFADGSCKKFVAIKIGSDSAVVHTRYAKQIKCNSIGIRCDYIPEYRNNPDIFVLKLFLVNPQYYKTPVLSDHTRNINTTLNYSQSDMDFYNQNMVLKSISPFSNSLATDWFLNSCNGYIFGVRWDLQQQTVIKFQLKTRLTLV